MEFSFRPRNDSGRPQLSALLRKRGKRVRQDRSVIRHATQMLSHSASPIPDKTYAKQCCTSTFASFSSPQMSSCGYWRTARSDVQTTTRGHLDRIDGNSVRPMKRLAASADAVLVPCRYAQNLSTSET